MNRKLPSLTTLALLAIFAMPLSAGEWTPESLSKAIASSPARPAADSQRDAGRKAGEVLIFFGVNKGMTALDLIAAGGWYTEALSVAVGEHGKVYAQNPPAVLQMREAANEKAISARLANGRLANVERLNVDLAAMDLANSSIDFAITALNFHDIYNRYGPDAAIGMMKKVLMALKPGGVFGVIDHNGAAGNDNAKLHRIQKTLVEAAASKAGFLLEGESDLLGNPDDPLNVGVFDPGVRGNTDRFVLKLRKPLD